jgi:hypothetical protein
MNRKVMGTLFVDYVRMLRAHKAVDWKKHLTPDELQWLTQKIQPTAWYPMGAFEHMGLAILQVIAGGDLETVKAFGSASVDWLVEQYPTLMAQGDPRESIMRFQVLRQSFFNFNALEVLGVTDGEAQMRIAYQMAPLAEEAASLQAMGFFERLLDLAGAKNVQSKFSSRVWAGDPETVLELTWE